MPKLCQNQDDLLRRATPVLINHPFEHLSLQGIADACGVSLWALRYNFDNAERLFRAVATHLIDQVAAAAGYEAELGASVRTAIAGHAAFLADLFDSEAYRGLAFLVVRNGRHHRWLEEAYEKRVVARICADFEAMVQQAGLNGGSPILVRAGVARRYFKRLETELVLSRLLPALVDGSEADREGAIKAAAAQAFEGTYLFDWQASTAA